ncbi:MAG: hypothetical protein KDE33_27995 [Bacteroidetes bacterium]|nr:hypothetical protein [Bacteroidota bacterium]
MKKLNFHTPTLLGYSNIFKTLFLYYAILLGCTTVENESTVTNDDIKKGKTASFILKRKKNSYVARLANVNVYINETPMGHIENGEEKTFHFFPSKDGTTNVRLESADIDGIGIFEAIERGANIPNDSTLISRFRKEFEIKARRGSVVRYYCSLDSKELLVREIEEVGNYIPPSPSPRIVSKNTPPQSEQVSDLDFKPQKNKIREKEITKKQDAEPNAEERNTEAPVNKIAEQPTVPEKTYPQQSQLSDIKLSTSNKNTHLCSLVLGKKKYIIREKNVNGDIITFNFEFDKEDIQTFHPDNSYQLLKVRKNTKLIILNNQNFWSKSIDLKVKAHKKWNDFIDKDIN